MLRLIRLIPATIVMAGMLHAQGTRVVFEASAAAPFPFPADTLTVPDPQQKTGLRMNLPLPDCNAEPSTCQEVGLVNELDGFSTNPRIQVKFSGPVDVNTLRDGIFFVWMDKLFDDQFGLYPAGHVMRINEVLYDPATNTAYAKPDEILYQRRQYALVVTSAVRDMQGNPASADPAFEACVAQTTGYCGRLRAAVAMAGPKFAPHRIVAASVFTTLSTTAWLESARDALEMTSPAYRFERSFDVREIAGLTIRRHATVGSTQLASQAFPVDALPSGGLLAFGSYYSPRFMDERQVIPAVPSGQAVALPAVMEEITVAAWVPEGPKPPGGFPAVIWGHGNGGNFFNSVNMVAPLMTARGYAVIGIFAAGHGGGPAGKLDVRDRSGRTTQVKFIGRSADMDRNGSYAAEEGCTMLVFPGAPQIGQRDCARQSALDMVQLTRAIRIGMDLDGDGTPDLDGARVSYWGQSMGAFFGTLLMGVDPNVHSAVLANGGSSTGSWRFAWANGTAPGARTPSLLNAGNTYNIDYVLRYEPVKVLSVPGALALQEYLERLEWYQMPGDPLAWAPHMRQSTLPGVPLKNVMIQFATPDQSVPNNTQSAWVRAGGLRESTVVYRHDLARLIVPGLLSNGHSMFWPLYMPNTDPVAHYLIGTMIQQQQADFLASGGIAIRDMNPYSRLVFGRNLFETPAVLPEDPKSYKY